MSKLEDMFNRATARSSQPLGFGSASKDSSAMDVLLIGYARSQQITKSPRLSQVEVDAIVLDSGGKPVSKTAAKALKDVVWGSQHTKFDAESVKELKEQGCDFLVFDAAQTSQAAIGDAEMASFIFVSGEFDRMSAAAVNDLGITGVLLVDALEDYTLTVQHLINIAKIQALSDGPLLVKGVRTYTSSELAALNDAGVKGLLLALDDKTTIETIRANLEVGTPNRKKSRAAPWTALAPQNLDEIE